MKWYISSLTNHDYLLGAMVLCLDLYYDSMAEAMEKRPPNYDPYFWSPDQRAEMMRALETSQSIWNETVDTSMEAYKASNIIGIILEKLKATSPAPPSEPTTAEVFARFDEEKPEHSAAMGLGMLSGGLSPNSAAAFNAMMSQSPRGTNYGNFDVGMSNDAVNAGLTSSMPLDPANPFASLNSIASPFSVFNAPNGPSIADMSATTLDWVSFLLFVYSRSGRCVCSS
jgi:hypothetical protein